MTLTKNSFRQICLKKMKKIPKNSSIYNKNIINNLLMKELKGLNKKNILIYYPLPIEADIRKTILYLRKKNNLFIPFMENESFKIVPFRLPLQKKKFGIYEAGNSFKKINNIDIAIVPVVGVDGNLQRIGFGRGMYDRFFSKLKKRPYTIFTQAKICFTKEYICDHYDVTGDMLLSTDARLIKK
ncbi:5-formyltetrahydrofolate cyclo-ligase [Sulfurimonas lithotrophica]|uniref:5-formyltetrahydrofolate cyclo-ligase n=1 Tax=Sulfurimonas lithotrophica TaxID=2590022 RepID=A0A5P8P1F4_9BACT|nr:5-formyltetrahydrofolate cyclo-ligase [Sulfurimonas lithotrophica]QFR49529.1 5-formyltetrahydrofolate cyclo-ligase [Sulfurimonas lithotrophica]